MLWVLFFVLIYFMIGGLTTYVVERYWTADYEIDTISIGFGIAWPVLIFCLPFAAIYFFFSHIQGKARHRRRVSEYMKCIDPNHQGD